MTTSLRFAILTTDTLHHRYFTRQIAETLPAEASFDGLFIETRPYPWKRKARKHFASAFPDVWQGLAMNPYLRSSRQERKQYVYERNRFFAESRPDWPDIPRRRYFSVDEPQAVAELESHGVNLLFVYGTGILKGAVLRVAPLVINAHGGRLPRYRGLDTNLWAALEGAPHDMAVTLHRLDAKVDSGPIYRMETLPRAGDLSLMSLRFHTTLLCIQMFGALMSDLLEGKADPIPQEGPARYYNPMPVLLKRRTDRILRAYASAEPKL